MARPPRTRPVTAAEARAHIGKATEFLESAQHSLAEGRHTAATSLAVHAAIAASDAVCGALLGKRSAGQGHEEALKLLKTAGPAGVSIANDLTRLLPLKTKSEYDAADIPVGRARIAVEKAARCVTRARDVVAELS
jgi:HEPN domain-containing protein